MGSHWGMCLVRVPHGPSEIAIEGSPRWPTKGVSLEDAQGAFPSCEGPPTLGSRDVCGGPVWALRDCTLEGRLMSFPKMYTGTVPYVPSKGSNLDNSRGCPSVWMVYWTPSSFVLLRTCVRVCAVMTTRAPQHAACNFTTRRMTMPIRPRAANCPQTHSGYSATWTPSRDGPTSLDAARYRARASELAR